MVASTSSATRLTVASGASCANAGVASIAIGVNISSNNFRIIVFLKLEIDPPGDRDAATLADEVGSVPRRAAKDAEFSGKDIAQNKQVPACGCTADSSVLAREGALFFFL